LGKGKASNKIQDYIWEVYNQFPPYIKRRILHHSTHASILLILYKLAQLKGIIKARIFPLKSQALCKYINMHHQYHNEPVEIKCLTQCTQLANVIGLMPCLGWHDPSLSMLARSFISGSQTLLNNFHSTLKWLSTKGKNTGVIP
jgi:hypothetical protein